MIDTPKPKMLTGTQKNVRETLVLCGFADVSS